MQVSASRSRTSSTATPHACATRSGVTLAGNEPGYPVGGRGERAHPDGWFPQRPADSEGPMSGPMPPRHRPPPTNTHPDTPRGSSSMSMTNSQAVEVMNTVKEKISELLGTARALADEIDSQYTEAMGASAVIKNEEMLPALAGLVDAKEAADQLVEHLSGAWDVIDRTN